MQAYLEWNHNMRSKYLMSIHHYNLNPNELRSVSAGLTTVEPDTVQVCGFTDICVVSLSIFSISIIKVD